MILKAKINNKITDNSMDFNLQVFSYNLGFKGYKMMIVKACCISYLSQIQIQFQYGY